MFKKKKEFFKKFKTWSIVRLEIEPALTSQSRGPQPGDSGQCGTRLLRSRGSVVVDRVPHIELASLGDLPFILRETCHQQPKANMSTANRSLHASSHFVFLSFQMNSAHET